MKSIQEVSVLIAGCGSIGKRHARVLRGLGVRDLRACDPEPAQREALARESSPRLFSSYEEGLASRPAAVFLCTPPEMHVPMARAAIAAGADVFSEKPLADQDAGLDELEAYAGKAGRRVMTGLCFRFHQGLRQAKELLDGGTFGRLVSVRCLMGEHFPTVRPDYRKMYVFRHGGAFDLSHEVDLAAWYAGGKPVQVHCLAGSFGGTGFESPDVAEILVRFDNNVLAGIHLDFFQVPRRRQTELICTGGVILVEFARWDHCTVSTCQADGVWSRQEMTTNRDDMFRDEDRSFLESLVAGGPIECTIADARLSVDIIEQAMARSGT